MPNENSNNGVPTDAERAAMDRYGLSHHEASISVERQKVYGDPYVNHLGIAQTICGLLQPWALSIALMRPLPPHVVALLFSGMKLNRMRMEYHGDNFDDASVYQRFARAWQEEYDRTPNNPRPGVILPPPCAGCELQLVWVTPDGENVPASDPEPVGLNNGDAIAACVGA